MRAYIFIAMVAMVATYLYTPLIRHLAIQLGAVGEVRARDVHTVPTPRMGGVAMLLGFITAMFFASRLNFLQGEFRQNHQAWVVMAGAAMICLLGVADDVWDLDWMLKLAGQLLISVFVAWGGLQIISLPIGGLLTASPMISIAITALLIVVSINAVNFVDGLDGLAAGIVAIGGIAFGIYSYVLSRQQVSYASMATLVDVAMVGICLGFLLHNWHPAKLFMGDSGSMLLGYLITCASIIITGRLGDDQHLGLRAGIHADTAARARAVPAGARHAHGNHTTPAQGAVTHASRSHASASPHAPHRPYCAGGRAYSVGLGRVDRVLFDVPAVLQIRGCAHRVRRAGGATHHRHAVPVFQAHGSRCSQQ